MKKAVNYLDRFWEQVSRYRDDGEYTIDNSLAERCIRSLANEKKNSLFFGSDKMARVSAAYHFVFAEIVSGNRNYGKLVPATIGININKI